MGISERKAREKQEMRLRIIEAATEMFMSEGYEKTSIRNIAEKIEYSPATIYLYYKDKDELLYEVQKQAFSQLEEAFARDATSPDPWVRLGQICHSYVRFGKAHPEMYELMFMMRAPMNSIKENEPWRNNTDSFVVLLTCLTECMEKGLLRFKDVTLAAFSVWAMGHGLVSLDVSCRLQAMNMTEQHVEEMILASIEQYLNLIKS
ncbi:MAG: TetR/AcrR family transcriptional regulator [Taibaiella sp.]|nr:TetR/AcrR family transcriptional regulator [Taibaiella sp.]